MCKAGAKPLIAKDISAKAPNYPPTEAVMTELRGFGSGEGSRGNQLPLAALCLTFLPIAKHDIYHDMKWCRDA
jgi:hypothetical protein